MKWNLGFLGGFYGLKTKQLTFGLTTDMFLFFLLFFFLIPQMNIFYMKTMLCSTQLTGPQAKKQIMFSLNEIIGLMKLQEIPSILFSVALVLLISG